MTIEPNGYKKLIDENTKLKNDLLRVGEMEDYWNIKSSKLEEENEKLYKPHEVFKFKEQIERLKIDKYKYIELYKQKFDEHEQLKQRVFKLVRTNTTLQNDLFSEQLEQDETEEYINRLKQELFNLYLKHY